MMTKKTAAMTAGAAIMLAALVLVAIPELGLQPIGLAVSIAIVAMFLVLSIRASERQHRAALREITRVDNRVSRVEYRTQPIHDIRGSVVKTSAESREALMHLRELADQGIIAVSPTDGASVAGPGPRVERSVFAPDTIRSNAIQGRPNMHTAGRDAARQEADEASARNLSRLLHATEAERQREFALFGVGTMVDRLRSLGSVTQLSAGSGTAALPTSLSYAVVDVPSLAVSSWRGVLDASNSQLFTEFRNLLVEARKRGAVVVVHGTTAPSHFSATLESLAHVLVRDGIASTRWGDDVGSDVIAAMTSEAPAQPDDSIGER